MTPGTIIKLAEIVPTSYRASQDNVIYVFNVGMEHEIPVNGRVRITIDPDMSMVTKMIENNCYRLDFSSRPINLDCFVNQDENYFDVIVRSTTFGNSGLPAG